MLCFEMAVEMCCSDVVAWQLRLLPLCIHFVPAKAKLSLGALNEYASTMGVLVQAHSCRGTHLSHGFSSPSARLKHPYYCSESLPKQFFFLSPLLSLVWDLGLGSEVFPLYSTSSSLSLVGALSDKSLQHLIPSWHLLLEGLKLTYASK